MAKLKNASQKMSDAEKFCTVRREAIYTFLSLAVLIVFWLFAGFGTSSSDAKIFGLPFWAVFGTVGVWIFAIFLSFVLSRILFKDMDLGGDGDE